MESKEYLSEQIITYLGNKRSLLKEIEKEIIKIKKKLKKEKIVSCDLFSGSGIVARMLKQHSSKIIANDLEEYSYLINKCYLSNKKDFNFDEYNKYLNYLNNKCATEPYIGLITKNYAPKDENNITVNDRVFYTRDNAIFIDSFRKYIEEIPTPYRDFFLCQLITEASIHTNTSGVFKGFYKNRETGLGMYGGIGQNALKRIKGKIEIKVPVFSEYETEYVVTKMDAVELSKQVVSDVVYIDPPYNQHPYGANYFMLNVIINNEITSNISKVSGIPDNWNHSTFNYKKTALDSFEEIIRNLKTSYIVISYNNEGFITYEQMVQMLKKYGKVETRRIKYNAFRGSRNLSGRDLYTNEYLFIVKKEK